MYRSRLKVKTLILLCMTGVLMILTLRRDPDRKGETGEELLISEEEGGEETGEAVGQEKIWTSPGRDAKIRVLLLDQSGSIYHKEKMQGKDIRENLITMRSRRGGSLSMKYRWRNIFGLWFPARCRLPMHWKR